MKVLGALQAYCSSYYGCLAGLYLGGAQAAQLSNCWTTNVNLTWSVPRATRTYFDLKSCFRASHNCQFRCCFLSRSPRRCLMGQEDLFPALRNIGGSLPSLRKIGGSLSSLQEDRRIPFQPLGRSEDPSPTKEDWRIPFQPSGRLEDPFPVC